MAVEALRPTSRGRPRRRGHQLDPERLGYEMSRRGLTQRRLAQLAGIHEMLVSRAMRGTTITDATLRKIASALTATAVIVGADLVLVEPAQKAAAPTPEKDVERGAPRRTRRHQEVLDGAERSSART